MSLENRLRKDLVKSILMVQMAGINKSILKAVEFDRMMRKLEQDLKDKGLPPFYKMTEKQMQENEDVFKPFSDFIFDNDRYIRQLVLGLSPDDLRGTPAEQHLSYLNVVQEIYSKIERAY